MRPFNNNIRHDARNAKTRTRFPPRASLGRVSKLASFGWLLSETNGKTEEVGQAFQYRVTELGREGEEREEEVERQREEDTHTAGTYLMETYENALKSLLALTNLFVGAVRRDSRARRRRGGARGAVKTPTRRRW